MKYILLALFTLLFSTGYTKKSEFLINGTLLDENKQPLPYTTVLLVNAWDTTLVKGSVTDSAGLFEINPADTGHFRIAVDAIGYTKYYSEPFSISENSTSKFFGPIQLQVSDGKTLGEVTVVTQRKFIDMQAGKMIVTPDNSPISAGSTAYEVLKRSPGVSIDQNQNLTLKGKTNVMVFIDDKPTYMTQDQLMNYLRTMPAGQIATIEIINNPGAKYDASGNSGIINIRTKKLSNKGYNGSLKLAGAYGWYPKTNNSLQLNYRNKYFNLFGSYGYANRKRGDKNEFDRLIPVDDGTSLFDQAFENTATEVGHQFKLGSDFYLGSKSTLGVLVKGGSNESSDNIINTTVIRGFNPMGFDSLYADNRSVTPFKNITYNLNFMHMFDSTGSNKLNLDFDVSPYKSNTESTYLTNYYNFNGTEAASPQELLGSTFSDVMIYAGKADYTHTLNKTTSFETGLKSSYVTIDNGINFRLNENGSYVDDTSRNNDFRYDENINAAYFSLAKQFKKASFNLGLRTEHTSNKGFSKTLDSTVTRQYINLFPSLNFSWDVDSTNNLSLAYSRRIDRPSYQDLNPFLYFADQYTFMKGNPFLKPQFTHGVSLTHTFMQFLFTTVGTDQTFDYMGDIIEQDTASKISFMTKTNFNRFSNYYVNVSTGAPIKKLFLLFNFTGFYSQYKTNYNSYAIDNGQFSYNVYLSATYSFKHDWKLELSGFYNSKMVYGIFKMSPMYMVEGGIKKSFPKYGINIDLSVSDIFNTMRNSIVLNDNGIDATFRNKWETRVATLALTWNFGKQDLKPRRRSTATEDEQNRVKSGGGGIGK